MNWSDTYKNQLDDIHAPDALKERLLAMEVDADPSDAPRMTTRRHKITHLRFGHSKAKVWQIAAALVCCVGLVAVAGPALRNVVSTDKSFSMQENGAADESYITDKFEAPADAETSMVGSDLPDPASGESVETDTTSPMLARSVEPRKVVYTAELHLEATDYTSTRTALEQALADTNGYVQQSEEHTQPNDSRYLYCTYRIPVDRYAEFLDLAGAAGNLIHTSETADDVTTQYIDIQAHVNALTAERDRLLELQQQAENLTDLLTIEDQLTSTQSELESWQTRLNYLNDQTDYCTVNLTVTEVKTYTPVETNLITKVADTFQRALQAFGNTLLDLLLWVISLWPWLVLIGIVCGVIFWSNKKRKK